MSDKYIKEFYNEVNDVLDGNYKIILERKRNIDEEWIEYDTVKWEIEEPIKSLVNKLKNDTELSFEEKILKIHESLSLNYTYDDNVLFFFKKDMSDPENIKYIAVDWYGRIVDEKWQERRNTHNRRICYEFSRIYAKSINELIDSGTDLEAFMLGDKENTHYVVGLSGKDYSAILDVDDFNKIKDLTRIKLGLTLDGINILRDENGKLKNVVDNFNKERLEDLEEISNIDEKLKVENFIEYLEKVIEIIRKYHLDEQGFMEYIKAKIEKEEIEIEKIWREVKGGQEKRYVRCLVFGFGNKKYLVDSVEQNIKLFDSTNLDIEKYVINNEEHGYPYFGG